MEEVSDETRARVFTRLKPYCVDLLELLRNPKKNASFLPEMADLLRSAPTDALQASLDFTLFPLLLLLDAAVHCRSGEKADSERSLGAAGAPLKGLVISDRVAEGILMCLEEMLMKCHLGSVNQMVVVLKKLTHGAMLSPSEASEEFRKGIIRCLRAMLLRLQPCSSASCSCKQVSNLPIVDSSRELISTSKIAEKEECLLAFLQSQDASAAVGHLLSLFLQTAELEAARGHIGSGSLRMEAFLTLRVLVSSVGSADALAYFLPGIVSRLGKALSATKSMVSGAAGSTGSTEYAVRGLTEFLVIVFKDDANRWVLELSSNDTDGFSPSGSKSTQAVLKALRHLPVRSQNLSENFETSSLSQSITVYSSKNELQDRAKNYDGGRGSLYVQRTKEWIEETSSHIDKLLSSAFPHLCVHPAEKVRKAMVDGISGLLSYCNCTLKRSKLILVECLCVLVCDTSEAVSVAAMESLESLFTLGEKFLNKNEISEIFTRLIEVLPRVVLGSEETVAVSHAQTLLAFMYYAGPELVVDHLLSTPIKAAQTLESLGLALSHNSRFAGSVEKLVSSKPLPIGYLLSVAELKASSLSRRDGTPSAAPPFISMISPVKDKDSLHSPENIHGEYELPCMPPWFLYVGGQNLYKALAGILRLVGLSLMAEHGSDVSLSGIIDIQLDYFHKLISDLRMKEYSKEGWQTWYSRSASGQLLRQTSTAVCIINEIIYGLSDTSVNLYSKMFRKIVRVQGKDSANKYDSLGMLNSTEMVWTVREGRDARNHVTHCVQKILHEYLSPELWSLPTDQASVPDSDVEGNVSLHFFRDGTMLQQVIIEGIGIFSIVLGKDVVYSGFMHSCLYTLLQNLISSNNQIKSASDAVLGVLSATSGHATVGDLVVANADYIIDSLCRQLRHLDVNPHVPGVIAAMFSYIGAAHYILPLLEEPMRAVSLELEVLGRHEHPSLTVPFLKAVGEITKTSRLEACRLPGQAESHYMHVISKVSTLLPCSKLDQTGSTTQHMGCLLSEKVDAELEFQHLEEMLLELNEMKRYRGIVGSLVKSCLNAAIPLVASMKELVSVLALDIVEDATISLAKVEETCKHEKEAKSAIERAFQNYLHDDLQDDMDAADEGENVLLPAMNKVWPYLVLCLKNKLSVVVIRRCTNVLSTAVQISGGGFFVRRFQTDGPIIWKLLYSSSFQRKPISSREEKQILLPYRNTSVSLEPPMAETSSLKIQLAVLNMIADISSNRRSASAMEAVLKKVSGLVVGIACSGVAALRDPSLKALAGLACIDPDLIWLLLADVYYTIKKKDFPSPPTSDSYELPQLLPPPASTKDYLYVQYGGEGFGFDIDSTSVEIVFHKMQSEVFTE